MLKVLATLLLVLSSSQIFSSDSSEITRKVEYLSEEEREAIRNSPELSELSAEEREMNIAFFSLDWKDTGAYKLEESNSTISLPEGYKLLIGEEAKKGRELTCMELNNPNLEAAVYDADFENTILFESYQDGYVSLDDWEDIDSKGLLKSISDSTEEENIERRKNGNGELHVIGWIQEPILDRDKNIVYWALEAESNAGAIINSVALRLGREGFEKLIWVTQKASYIPIDGHLDIMLRSHTFDPGYRYNDYQTGDKIAGYGIASLVAATVGGKIIKTGGLAILFKKLVGFIFAGMAALFYKFKNFFKRKED